MTTCATCGTNVDTTGFNWVALRAPVHCWECFQQEIIKSGGALRRCQHCKIRVGAGYQWQQPADLNIFDCDDCYRSRRAKLTYRSR